MATAVSTQLGQLTGANTIEQMMSDVNSLKTLSALATDAAGSGDFVPVTGGTFTGNLGIEKNGATTLTLTRTNSASNFAEIEAAGGSGEQLTIKSNVSNQTGGFTAFDVGGSERMRIDSSGKIGIGTTSPQDMLHISATSPRIRLTDTNTGVDHQINADSSVGNLIFNADINSEGSDPATLFYIQGSEKVRINSAGNVGIGTSTPDVKFQVQTSTNANIAIVSGTTGISAIDFGDSDDRNAGLIQYLNTDNAMTFRTSGAGEDMRIDSSGNITFKQGVVNLESASGNPAQMNFYCETGNAHYTRIQSSPHASYSGNVVLTLPTTSGTLATTAAVATTGKAIAMAIVFG